MAEHEEGANSAQNVSQPGQIIAPGGASVPAAPAEPAPTTPTTNQAVQAQSPAALTVNAAPAPDKTDVPAPPETAFAESFPGNSSQQSPPAVDNQAVSWTASEYVAHEKSASWYMALTAAAIVVVAAVYLLTKDYITCGIILFCAFILGIFASRKPRELEYRIDGAGIQIGDKRYVLEEFRSFAIVPEGAFASIVLMPLKRFAPLLTVYYAPEREDAIVSILANWLPMEEAKSDPVDSLMRRIRF